uniref:Lactase-like n=1 Tax=Nannospalax galili TaxID=1026970 RepID=A0A8C6QYZ6_NANGA
LCLGWVLLGPRLGAAGRGSSEEASYYGTFPPGFSWDAGSSAYQTEGTWDQDGKGPSIWSAFTHARKGKVVGDDTADTTCDSYYKVQEDINLLRELQVSHYRFSLSWPRLLPTSIRAEQVNEKGVKFYSDFIDSLLKSNTTPTVTLYHWDLPQVQRTWTHYFRDYTDLCFEIFGDQVKHWLTFSNPRVSRDPFPGAWHAPQAHAPAWHSHNSTWRSKQRGLMGISLNFMKDHIGEPSHQGLDMSRLPVFSLQEKSYIKGTSDFLGLGHFTTCYVTERKYPSCQGPSYQNDRDLVELVDPNWTDLGSLWLYSMSWGFRRLLNFSQTQYSDPPIYVTENGATQKLHCAQLCDEWRIQYLRGYINEMLKAIKDGVNIKGYNSWSLLDKFEWEKGYADRYGFYYVEFNVRNKPRYPKASIQYYRKITTVNGFPNPYKVERWHHKSLETCSINNQMLATELLLRHIYVASEITVPTVCTLCIFIIALLPMLLLQSHN